MTLKLAMVGCGGMGLRHAFAYIELRRHFDSFDLVAVCDRHAESANHVASVVESATGRRPEVYTDFDQMLAAENDIDAVDITTDTRMHHSFAIGAMESGASVLTEKPMALTMSACRTMAETAERTGKVLSIGEQYRRDPMNRLTKALVDSGIIGHPGFAMKVGLSGGSGLMHNTGWRALKSRAGSIIIEQGVHEADLLIYFLGNVKSVYSATGLFTPLRTRQEMNPTLKRFYGHRVEDEFENEQEITIDQEDTALAVLKFEAGPIAQFTITNASHGYSALLNSVHGDKGTILLPPTRTGRPPTVNLEGRDTPLSHDEMLSMLVLLLVAGNETTTTLIGNVVLELLAHPDELKRLRDRPELLPSALEEVLRFASPVQFDPRRATRPVKLHGREIGADEFALCWLGSANRDETVFERPDVFDISRERNPHLAFGFGAHYCLGANLARLEATIALRRLYQRFPDLTLIDRPPWAGGALGLALPALRVSVG